MKNRQKILPWMYSLPALVLVGIIVIFPILYTGYISLTNMNMYHWDDYHLIGLSNFKRALLKVDSGFLNALLTTILWTVVNMVIQVVVSFFIALGLNAKGLKLARVYKTLLMFPWAMPAYVSILLWRVGMYNTEFGFFNKVLAALGFEKINFLSENVLAFFSCMILNLWMALPFMIMMMDGALQSIDKSYYESARLDGAGFFKQNWYITVPAIRPIRGERVATTYVCFTEYDVTIPNKLVAFHKVEITNTFGEFLAANHMAQARIAETEKYAHVTFFFNGGVEAPNAGEDRILVKSPKVATYDLQPEMSAYEVCDKLTGAIRSGKYDVIIINFANPDMVGHTGVEAAAIKAVETVDECVGKAVEAIKEVNGQMFICADHGNAEQLVDYETGEPYTAHTTNPVPFILVNADPAYSLREGGCLADIAPTLIELMGLEQPKEMTGKSLLVRK